MNTYFLRYVQFANSIITDYNGGEPFHLYLKKYFSSNKKHGSRDRKNISNLCYNYFRLGKGVSKESSIEERILLANFIVEPIPSQLKDGADEPANLTLEEKADVVRSTFDIEKVFPFQNELSPEIDAQKFNLSFLTQPKLFVRIRPGQHKLVISKLGKAFVSFEKIGKDCLAFPNTTKITDILNIDKDAVIQDYNSQRVGEFLSSIDTSSEKVKVWDCCAGSGGKSILAYDVLKDIELTVSDTRKNILENLKTRFHKAGIKNYRSLLADLSLSLPVFGNAEISESSNPQDKKAINKSTLSSDDQSFDIILADVPCSGSGTWVRTPESLQLFNVKEINRYALLQRKIVINAAKHLKTGSHLLYITCSVFKKENEDNVAYFQEDLGLKLEKEKYFKGWQSGGASLYIALLKK
ncbi:MAG: Fmu (Sun) domain-containing protein [Ginsengibacter sp.]